MLQLRKYTGFGLNIESEIEFPELLVSSFNQSDLTIEYGSIPASLFPDEDILKSYSLFSENEFLHNFPNIAKYHATGGNLIRVDPYLDADKESIRLFLLGISMAAILMQRKKILLHASAILQNDHLILFVGESKAGKSSMAAELSKRGFTIFSDDVCVLESKPEPDAEILSYSSYPMMKLWENTLLVLNNEQFDKSYKIRPAVPKYGQFFHKNFITSPYPIKKIFVLNPVEDDTQEYSYRKLNGMEAFEKLSQNTYRKQFIQESLLQVIHFKLISKLVQETEIIELSRSRNNSEINTFTDFVETLFEKED
jgi:hypothetical protein